MWTRTGDPTIVEDASWIDPHVRRIRRRAVVKACLLLAVAALFVSLRLASGWHPSWFGASTMYLDSFVVLNVIGVGVSLFVAALVAFGAYLDIEHVRSLRDRWDGLR